MFSDVVAISSYFFAVPSSAVVLQNQKQFIHVPVPSTLYFYCVSYQFMDDSLLLE